MNPSTAFGAVLADELARCGLREVVVAPGSRSTPLAMAFWELEQAGRVRLHVRIDERSAAFTALGLAKASGQPVVVLCTSGTAAANFHPAVIEADESAVPLLVLTADRPPELRGTGASQTVDQVKLYGSAVRWYAEAGVPERRPGMAGYWRSLACRAWAQASGALGTLPGPVHLNVPLRDPLVPGPAAPGTAVAAPVSTGQLSGPFVSGPATGSDGPVGPGHVSPARIDAGPLAGPGSAGHDRASARDQPPRETGLEYDNSNMRVSAPLPATGSPGLPVDGSGTAEADWPESLAGRADGAPWTRPAPAGPAAEPLELPWAERGVVVCGDGDYDATALVELAERAGWPLLAEPSSGARRGPNALTGYQYLLASPGFMAAHRPQVIVSAGRPGLSRAQSALLALARSAASGRARPGRAAGDGQHGVPGETSGDRDTGGAQRSDLGSWAAEAARAAEVTPAVRHVVVASGPGQWADPQRAATDVAASVRLTGAPAAADGRWLSAWLRADAAATGAAEAVLGRWGKPAAGSERGQGSAGPDAPLPEGRSAEGWPLAAQSAGARSAERLSEPGIARELVAALPENAVLWCGNSLSVRDIDVFLPPRTGVRVIASRGASGIDGTFSTAAGAAMAHAAQHPGAVGFALIGDLSLLHDAPGLAIGPAEPRPDLCVIVVNNDGGGIFEGLEPARFKDAGPGDGTPAAAPSVFERVFGTAHGASVEQLAAAFGVPYTLAERPGDLAKAVMSAQPGSGPRIVEARTGRAANADLRTRMREAAVTAAEAAPRAGA